MKKGSHSQKTKAEEKAAPVESNTPESVMKLLNDYLKHWQRELRLSDFDILLRYFAQGEAEGAELATCTSFAREHLFVIAFRYPAELAKFENANRFNCQWENLLVHELLHVRDSLWRNETIQDELEEETRSDLYEIGLDAVSEALVRARRGITR